ncbi:MAG: nucleotide exchange factor GrpE [Acidimicrobiales bacterium]
MSEVDRARDRRLPDAPDGGQEVDDLGAEADQEEESVEELIAELEAVATERDEYLALAQAKQAELENYRKLVVRRQTDHLEQAGADLVVKLLPVLDALDSAVAHGEDSVVAVRSQLVGLLEKEGLARVECEGAPFDPNQHEAVAHEPADGGEPVVIETLRAGYRWHGRLLRAAMVRVRG